MIWADQKAKDDARQHRRALFGAALITVVVSLVVVISNWTGAGALVTLNSDPTPGCRSKAIFRVFAGSVRLDSSALVMIETGECRLIDKGVKAFVTHDDNDAEAFVYVRTLPDFGGFWVAADHAYPLEAALDRRLKKLGVR